MIFICVTLRMVSPKNSLAPPKNGMAAKAQPKLKVKPVILNNMKPIPINKADHKNNIEPTTNAVVRKNRSVSDLRALAQSK